MQNKGSGIGNSSVTGTENVSLSATGSDDVGGTKVEFYAAGSKLGENSSASYTWSDPVTSAQNDTRLYSAKALDAGTM